MGIGNIFAQHLETAAYAYDQSLLTRVFAERRFESALTQPAQVVGRLLAARQDDEIGRLDAFGIVKVSQGYGRLGFESIEVGEVGKRWKSDDADAQWAREGTAFSSH